MRRTDEICKAFSLQAAHYDKVSKIQQEIGERLLERLMYLKIAPRYILDLGCGTGKMTKLIQKRYPNACVIGFDISHAMLVVAKKNQGYFKKYPLVAGDMMKLPFQTGIFDLVIGNQVLHWAEAIPGALKELNRVMAVEGCLMFSTLGPDTFKELRTSWANINDYAHVNAFWDMHDVGDALVQAYFLDPVMDMELITVHYSDSKALLASLKAQGVKNIHEKRNPGLTGKGQWQQFLQALAKNQLTSGEYPLTYEVVYGHAWKGAKQAGHLGQETVIPISAIKR